MRLLVSLSLITILAASPASAANATKYKLTGPCKVKTESFEKTFSPELFATISGPDDDVRIDVRGEDQPPCMLKGKRAGDVITMPAGQKCVQAKGLDGTLTSGRAITKGSDITVVARWKVVGDVKVLFRSMHVDGTIDATLKGSKITGP